MLTASRRQSLDPPAVPVPAVSQPVVHTRSPPLPELDGVWHDTNATPERWRRDLRCVGETIGDFAVVIV
jgi:hypothetical protein